MLWTTEHPAEFSWMNFVILCSKCRFFSVLRGTLRTWVSIKNHHRDSFIFIESPSIKSIFDTGSRDFSQVLPIKKGLMRIPFEEYSKKFCQWLILTFERVDEICTALSLVTYMEVLLLTSSQINGNTSNEFVRKLIDSNERHIRSEKLGESQIRTITNARWNSILILEMKA